MKELSGKVAVVTGVASGIGLATHADIREGVEARFKKIMECFDGSEVAGGDFSADTFEAAAPSSNNS